MDDDTEEVVESLADAVLLLDIVGELFVLLLVAVLETEFEIDTEFETEFEIDTEAVEVTAIIGEGDGPCGATQLTVLMRLFIMSATYRVPSLSKATLAGPLKDAAVPMPSLRPTVPLPTTIDMLLVATSTRRIKFSKKVTE